MYNSLLALRKVAKRYEYKSKGERKPLDDLVQVSFPHLQHLMTVVLTHNSIEAAQVMKMCLKIFWSATMYQLPQVSGVDVNFWFQVIAQILDKRLPEASEGLEPQGQPVDVEERALWPWWKVKIPFFVHHMLFKCFVMIVGSCILMKIVEEVGSTHCQPVHSTVR